MINTEKTSNELIALFMGMKPCECGGKEIHYRYGEKNWEVWMVEELKYHQSWDWIMPVVEKILLWEVRFNTQSEEAKRAKEVTEMNLCCELKDVYDEVVDFIKWFNTKHSNHS